MSVDWNYFDKFDAVIDKYMPDRGEGETLASQIVTAVNKLIYKWYNDGDVYDNNYGMEGWANDLSSYANWLFSNVPEADTILNRIEDCSNDNEYESILRDLADTYLNEDVLSYWANEPKVGSIYECDGPFSFNEYDDEDDEDDWDEEYEDDDWDEDEDEDEEYEDEG